MADTEQERSVLNAVAAYVNGRGELEPVGAPGIDGVIALADGAEIGLSITSIAASADFYLNKSSHARAQIWNPVLQVLRLSFPCSEIEIQVSEADEPPHDSLGTFIRELTSKIESLPSMQSGVDASGVLIRVNGIELFVFKEDCGIEEHTLADVWVYFVDSINYRTKIVELLEKKSLSLSKARSCDAYELAVDIVDWQLVNPRRLRRIIGAYCQTHALVFRSIYILRDGCILNVVTVSEWKHST